jgi:hypothetical protein
MSTPVEETPAAAETPKTEETEKKNRHVKETDERWKETTMENHRHDVTTHNGLDCLGNKCSSKPTNIIHLIVTGEGY